MSSMNYIYFYISFVAKHKLIEINLAKGTYIFYDFYIFKIIPLQNLNI